MELGDDRASATVVEVGADKVEQHLESIVLPTTLVLSVEQCRPGGRLLLCRGASGSAHQVTHTRYLTDARNIFASISCLLAHRMSSERRGERILIQAIENACQV